MLISALRMVFKGKGCSAVGSITAYWSRKSSDVQALDCALIRNVLMNSSLCPYHSNWLQQTKLKLMNVTNLACKTRVLQ